MTTTTSSASFPVGEASLVAFAITVSIAMIVTFVCSVLEACLLSLSPTDLASLAEKKPRISRIWRGFKDNIERPIAVILIVNTLAHTIGATMSGAQFSQLWGHKWVAVYSLVFTFVMIQWAELLPKSMGVRYNKKAASILGVPMQIAVRIMQPLVYFFELLNKPFEGKRDHPEKVDTIGEITVLARFASISNQITKEQQDIVTRSLALSNCLVKDIMVERKDMKFLSTGMGMGESLIEAHIHHHTRYPLMKDDNPDEVIGFVNVKDIVSAMKMNPKDPSLKGICRPVMFIQSTEKVAGLLKDMTRGYQHIAVVKEGDRVVGMVTMEDLIEAIVGELQDEYDVLPTHVYSLHEGRFLVGGGVTLGALSEKTGPVFEDSSLTVNDWLFRVSPVPPKVEARFDHKGVAFIVRKMRRSRVYEVVVEKPFAE